MRTIIKVLIGSAALVFGAQAQALVITPDDCSVNGGGISCVVDTDPNTAKNPELSDLEAAFGITGLEELYKDNVGGSEEGPLASSYETTYANTPSDPSDAWIKLTGGTIVDCSTGCVAVVKDGRQLPGWYAFDLTGLWNGIDDLHFEGFWPNQGSISHIALLSPSTTVPEPGILALVGIGLLGLGLRRLKKA